MKPVSPMFRNTVSIEFQGSYTLYTTPNFGTSNEVVDHISRYVIRFLLDRCRQDASFIEGAHLLLFEIYTGQRVWEFFCRWRTIDNQRVERYAYVEFVNDRTAPVFIMYDHPRILKV